MTSPCLTITSGVRLGAVLTVAVFSLLGTFVIGGHAQTEPPIDPWGQYRFLLGDWVSGPDSNGIEGGTNFSLDLDGKVLIRKNFANYPATKGKLAINHKDLMVLHLNGAAPAEADYWDNEGHTIHYMVRFNSTSDTLQFTSNIINGAPRFRLSYTIQGFDSLKVIFEAAPPGSPDSFSPYVSGIIHRKQ